MLRRRWKPVKLCCWKYKIGRSEKSGRRFAFRNKIFLHIVRKRCVSTEESESRKKRCASTKTGNESSFAGELSKKNEAEKR